MSLRIDQITQQESRLTNDHVGKIRRLLSWHSRYEMTPETFAGIGRPDLSALSQSTDTNAAKHSPRTETTDPVPVSVALPDGKRLNMPNMEHEDRQRVEALLGDFYPGARQHLEERLLILAEAAFKDILEGREATEPSENLQTSASALIGAYVPGATEAQHENQLDNAILLGVAGAERQLFGYFQKLADEQQIGAEVRTDIAELNDALADWPDDGSTDLFSYGEVIFHDDGSVSVVEHKNVPLTKAGAEALRDKLQGQVSRLGQLEGQQQVLLQKLTHEYQQAQNTISNVLKTQHETHRALAQNLKA